MENFEEKAKAVSDKAYHSSEYSESVDPDQTLMTLTTVDNCPKRKIAKQVFPWHI